MRVEVAVVGSTDHNFRRERRAETDWNRGPSAYQPNALSLGHTGSHSCSLFSPENLQGCGRERVKHSELKDD